MQTTEKVSKEILNLEKKYWKAMSDQDLDVALSLTDFPCLIAGAHGVQSVNEVEFIKMFKSSAESVRTFEFDPAKAEVRMVAPDTAVIAYKVQCTITKDGESKTMDAADTSTWIKRENKWVCAMHTETELLRTPQ